ncbi:MAG: hypothetical protein ABIX10_04560 [Acidimicrobiales bacterium]
MQLLTGPWPIRAAWALLPLLLGPALGDALAEHSQAVARTGSVLAWGGWAGGLVAVLLPTTVSLTALRIATPAALAAASWAALAGSRGATDALAVAGGAVAVVAAFSPSTGEVFVNGSSYGDERRLPLRVPGALLFGPIALAWAAAVAAPVAGPLLLAAEQWVPGAIVLAAGIPAAALAVRALHGLARRWVVLVPAGLVLHDHHALVEPVLFARRTIRHLGPAPADEVDGALDLTQRAFGLALVLELDEPVAVAPRRRDGSVRVAPVERLLLTPTRPGVVLRAAAGRRIATGSG